MQFEKDYEEFMDKYGKEVLDDALEAIEPDAIGMNRSDALLLAAAMKNCGYSSSDFEKIVSRSRNNKGTFVEQWDKGKIRGTGKHGTATKASIYDFAQKSGWKWPEPKEFMQRFGSDAPKAPTKPKKEEPKIYCLLDSVFYDHKPDAKEIKEIRTREPIPTPQPTAYQVKELADIILKGCTFYPSIYKKETIGTNANYRLLAQQIFVVDVDNEEQVKDENGKLVKDENGKTKKQRVKNFLTIDKALDICKKNDIEPCIVYKTFSNKLHEADAQEPYQKFRLVFALDSPLKVQDVGTLGIDAAINYFIGLFGEAADAKTTDTARLIFGTDEKEDAIIQAKYIRKNELLKRIYASNEQVPEEQEEPQEVKSGSEVLEDFLAIVNDASNKTFEPIPTGIKDLDAALEGGFIRKTLVTLGAPPAMGKTAFMQYMLENMAANGKDVLFLNLEMDRAQLLARSISRLAWKYYRADLSTLEILRSYSMPEDKKAIIRKAAERYKQEISQHFQYNPEGMTNDIDLILKAMQNEVNRLKDLGRPAPLICIDYLHLIATKEKDPIEGLKSAMLRIKSFAIENNTVVFMILANNRASSKEGKAAMDNARDTSGIEYTGDIMLDLTYTAIEDDMKYTYDDEDGKRKTKTYEIKDIRKLKKQAFENGYEPPSVCNQVSLTITKNRFTGSERRVKLVFDGKHNTYHQEESQWKNAKR